jgi:GMP synthase (glutamine-hydrolysing)
VPRALEARGRFFDMFERVLGAAHGGPNVVNRGIELVNVEGVTGSELPAVGSADGVILTGSPAYVRDEEPWMVRMQERARQLVLAGVPTLGVCFGHQILGEALGGRVERNPWGREIGTTKLGLTTPDPLVFRPGHDSAQELVQMSHLDSVISLPERAEVLARTELEPFAAVRYGPRTWGVQFHPEMDDEIIRHYLMSREEVVRAEGLNFADILSSVRDDGYGARMLERFFELVRRGP